MKREVIETLLILDSLEMWLKGEKVLLDIEPDKMTTEYEKEHIVEVNINAFIDKAISKVKELRREVLSSHCDNKVNIEFNFNFNSPVNFDPNKPPNKPNNAVMAMSYPLLIPPTSEVHDIKSNEPSSTDILKDIVREFKLGVDRSIKRNKVTSGK